MRTKSLHFVALVFEEVELLDVMGPIGVITSAGRNWNFRPFKVELAAATSDAVGTASGLALPPTRELGAATPIDVLLVPGGYGARKLGDDPALLNWLRSAVAGAEIVAALGNGLLPLARAGCLAGVEVSAAPEVGRELSALEPSLRLAVTDRPCASGKFLSARASALGLELGCEIIARAFGPKLAAGTASALGITWGAPPAVEIVP